MKTNLLKSLAFAAFLWMPFTQAFADSGYLTLWLKSGESLQVQLDDQPKITFNGTTIHLSTNEDEEGLSYEFSDVAYFTLNDKDLTNDMLATQKTSTKIIKLKKMANKIAISDAEENILIQIATLNGSVIDTLRADAEGSAFVDLSNEPHGVYIIKVGIIPFVIIK